MTQIQGRLSLSEVGPEAAAVVAAVSAAGGGEAWGTESIAGILSLPGAFGLLALVEEQPLGYLVARTAADESEVIDFLVLPGARRQGIGRALLTAAKESARRRGARKLFLEVARDNAAARALYDVMGFISVGLRPDYYRAGTLNYRDALIMQCDLVTGCGNHC